jgi:ribosomal protein S1
MSGHGGGDFVPDVSPLPCAKLNVKTTLNSPVPKVLSTLKKDDVLDVSLQGKKGPLVAVTAGGDVAGSITSSQLAKLIECIQDGYTFVAVVLRVDKGMCEVEVRPGKR